MNNLNDSFAALTQSVTSSPLFDFLGQPIIARPGISPFDEEITANHVEVIVSPSSWTTSNTAILTLNYDSSEMSFKDISLNGSGSLSSSVSSTEFGNIGTARIQINSSGGTGITISFKVKDNFTSSSIKATSFTLNGVPTQINIQAIAGDYFSPTIAVSASATKLSFSQDTLITFALNEASSDFRASDVIASGGTLSNFAGSGSSYTALFTPTPNSITSGVVRVANGVFTDAAGNANADGSDANNIVILAINTVPIALTRTNTLSVIVDTGVLGRAPVLLKDLKEVITTLEDRIQTHTIEYNGIIFSLKEVDSLITTVTRSGDFTQEFRTETAQAFPGFEDILYADAVAIVGVANIDQIILGVAGFDGDFVN